MIVFLFFVLGIVVGSFCNVVIFRLARGEGGIVMGRSRCQDCNAQLAWYENIPVISFIFLHGKCRHCHKALSWQYPFVELASGALFALVARSFFVQGVTGVEMTLALLVSGVFAAMLVVFVYDLRYMEVPMGAVWLGVFFALCSIGVRYFGGMMELRDVLYYIIAGSIAFLFFFSLSYYSAEKWMGYGDGYIALVIGLLLGPLGAFVAIVLGVWVGAIVGVLLATFSSKTLKSAIPFGPFLIGGMYASYVLLAFFPSVVNFLRI